MAHKNVIFGGGEFDLYINPEVVLLDIKTEQGFATSTDPDKGDIDDVDGWYEDGEEVEREF